MNLSEQQHSSSNQQEIAVLSSVTSGKDFDSSTAMISADTQVEASETALSTSPMDALALLDSRLSGMANTIVTLNGRVRALQQTLEARDAQLATVAQEKEGLALQVESFSTSHSQMLDGVEDLLKRFPSDEALMAGTDEAFGAMDVGLLSETVGTA